MKFTVKSLNEGQLATLEKTNGVELSLTVLYMDFLVSAVKTHGVAELIGREHLSLAGTAVDVIFKAKVSLGYPNTDRAREAVRTLCSPIWKNFVASCIEVTADDKYQYDAEKLASNKADVKSGKQSIYKAKKAKKKAKKKANGNQTVQERFAEAFLYLDKVTAVHKREEILEWMAEEIAKRS